MKIPGSLVKTARSVPNPGLTIILYANGGPNLYSTFSSLRQSYFKAKDEVLVLSSDPAVYQLWADQGLPGRFQAVPPREEWSQGDREAVIATVRGDYVLHLNEGQTFLPGALLSVQKAIQEYPGFLILFNYPIPFPKYQMRQQIASGGKHDITCICHAKDDRRWKLLTSSVFTEEQKTALTAHIEQAVWRPESLHTSPLP